MNVSITQSYRLIAADRNYVLQRLHTVDPTKSPSWKKTQAPDKPADLREEWRDHLYYPLNHGGLVSAVEYAIINEVNGRTEARTLAELLAEYAQEVARLRTTIIDAIVPQVNEVVASE